MPFTECDTPPSNPLMCQESEPAIGQSQDHAPLQTMEGYGAGHCVAGDFRACVNDQPDGFERFGLDDRGRSSAFQAFSEMLQIDNFSRVCVVHRHANLSLSPELIFNACLVQFAS